MNKWFAATMLHFTCALISLHWIEGEERQGGKGPKLSQGQERAT